MARNSHVDPLATLRTLNANTEILAGARCDPRSVGLGRIGVTSHRVSIHRRADVGEFVAAEEAAITEARLAACGGMLQTGS